MNAELLEAIRLLVRERGVDAEQLFEAIEESLVAAYKREFDAKTTDNIRAEVDRQTGAMNVYLMKEVVEEVEDPNAQIALSEALALDEDFEVGDLLEYELSPQDFGRLAAQSAKTAINLKLIQAERDRIQEEFSGLVGEVVTGVVQRSDAKEAIIDIERAEAVLSRNEQVRTDRYNFKERMKFYILRVDDKRGRPVIYVSRSHPNLVRKLFEAEVPEIQSGVVEIVNVAREAGSRTKMAVMSRDPNVDALGACVGTRGSRVQAVTDEMRDEKIDIIAWDPDETVFIRNALNPARVVSVTLHEDETTKLAEVVVPDQQLSLAIGREGQNARLAARLTGWKIDIKSESQAREAFDNDFVERFNAAADLMDGDEEQDAEIIEDLTPEQAALAQAAADLNRDSDSSDPDAAPETDEQEAMRAFDEAFAEVFDDSEESGTDG